MIGNVFGYEAPFDCILHCCIFGTETTVMP